MRNRWFGATGVQVPEIAVEGGQDFPPGDPLVLEDVSDVERLRDAHEHGIPVVVRASSVEAVQAGRWMSENDAHSFCPHMGLASGKVIVGYVGTPLKYNCSVFGAPVALAARCTGVHEGLNFNFTRFSVQKFVLS